MRRHAPVWLGLCLATVGIVDVLLAGWLWPVLDDRPLKMSCYWAMKAVIGTGGLLGFTGIVALLAPRDGARTAAVIALGIAVMQILMVHVIIPVMPHNVLHQHAHDLLAGLAVLVACAGLWVLRPEVEIDEALDAAAPPLEQPAT